MSDTTKTGHRQRLRDRFAAGEESSRTEEALLELLLSYSIPQKNLQPLAARLISEHGSISSLLEVPMESLCQIDGIKENSAVLLKLVDFIRKHHDPRRFGTESHKPPTQTALFETISPATEQKNSSAPKQRHKKIIRRRGTEMIGKALLKEAIQMLPSLPDTESLDDIRAFLRANLHFSSEQTRQRYTSYITCRMFPDGYADAPLRSFAKTFPDTRELRDVCFYRFLVAEPLEIEVIEHLVLPNIGTGRLNRERIRTHLTEKYPLAKSISDCGKAIIDALTAAGIASADRTKISFAYREIPAASFAFILHSEFPEPGMYDIRKLEENRLIRAMLWNPDRLLHTLYELRNQGWISKISEIDNMRQFTTRYTLDQVVKLM